MQSNEYKPPWQPSNGEWFSERLLTNDMVAGSTEYGQEANLCRALLPGNALSAGDLKAPARLAVSVSLGRGYRQTCVPPSL